MGENQVKLLCCAKEATCCIVHGSLDSIFLPQWLAVKAELHTWKVEMYFAK